MDVLPRVVEEAVGGARIDLHLPGLPELLERLLEPLDVVPGDPDVRVAVDVEDRAGQVLERGLVGDLAIVGRGGPDVLAAAGEQERVGAAHAEAGDSDAIPPDLLHAPEGRDGAQQALAGVLAAEAPPPPPPPRPPPPPLGLRKTPPPPVPFPFNLARPPHPPPPFLPWTAPPRR